MATRARAARSPTPLAIETAMTIKRAGELKHQLSPTQKAKRPSAVDLSGVTEFDTAGLQLLLLAKRNVGASKLPFQILAPSPCVQEALTLLQLDNQLKPHAGPVE